MARKVPPMTRQDRLELAKALDAANRKVRDAAWLAKHGVHGTRLREMALELQAMADQIDPNRDAITEGSR
jgi:hypothetical protein